MPLDFAIDVRVVPGYSMSCEARLDKTWLVVRREGRLCGRFEAAGDLVGVVERVAAFAFDCRKAELEAERLNAKLTPIEWRPEERPDRFAQQREFMR